MAYPHLFWPYLAIRRGSINDSSELRLRNSRVSDLGPLKLPGLPQSELLGRVYRKWPWVLVGWKIVWTSEVRAFSWIVLAIDGRGLAQLHRSVRIRQAFLWILSIYWWHLSWRECRNRGQVLRNPFQRKILQFSEQRLAGFVCGAWRGKSHQDDHLARFWLSDRELRDEHQLFQLVFEADQWWGTQLGAVFLPEAHWEEF